MPDIKEAPIDAEQTEQFRRQTETEASAPVSNSETETMPEQITEKPGEKKQTAESRFDPRRLISSKKRAFHLPSPRDKIAVAVEKILEEDLNDAYQRLSPVAKQEFKIEGEKTAAQIRVLLNTGKSHAKKIFRLLLRWLQMLPGINRFFLEQEAKIKTDKIMALKNKF